MIIFFDQSSDSILTRFTFESYNCEINTATKIDFKRDRPFH